MTPAFSVILTTLTKTSSSGSSSIPKMRSFSQPVLLNALDLYDLKRQKSQRKGLAKKVFGMSVGTQTFVQMMQPFPSIPGLMHSTRWLLSSSFFAGTPCVHSLGPSYSSGEFVGFFLRVAAFCSRRVFGCHWAFVVSIEK